MHTIWIKVQKQRISVYKDKHMIDSLLTVKFLTDPMDRQVVQTKIMDAIREVAESYDAED